MSLICIISIVIIDNDENSVSKHFVKNAFTFCLYLLRIVAKCIYTNHIQLELKRLSTRFKGKVEIDGKIHIIDCYRPDYNDFVLTIDKNQIINFSYEFPTEFDFTIFSEHSEGSNSKRAEVFSEQLDPDLRKTLFKDPNFQAVSNLKSTVNRQVDGTFEKVIDVHVKTFTDVLMAIVLLFAKLGLAFIEAINYPNELGVPITINDTDYVLVAYSLKSGCYKLVDQYNMYLTKLYQLLKGKDLTPITVIPDEAYVKRSDKPLQPLNPDFDINELFKICIDPIIKRIDIEFELFYSNIPEEVSVGLSIKSVKRQIGIDINNFVIRSRITSQLENVIDKYNRINVDGVRYIVNMYLGSDVSYDSIDYNKCLYKNDERILKDYIFKFKDEILFNDVLDYFKDNFSYYFLNDNISFNGVYIQDIINAIEFVGVEDESEEDSDEDSEDNYGKEIDEESETENLETTLNKYIDGLSEFFEVSFPIYPEWSVEKYEKFEQAVLYWYKSKTPKSFDEPLLRTVIRNCLFDVLVNFRTLGNVSNFDVLNDVCIKKFGLDLMKFDNRLGHDIDQTSKLHLYKIYRIIFNNHHKDLPKCVFNYCVNNAFE